MLIPFASSPGAPPFPQLHFEYWPSQIFWLAVTLAALWWILNRLALPRVRSTIEERRDTISGDLDKAAEFNLAAEEAEEAYEAALQNARAEAQKIADKTKAAIKDDLEVAMAEADKRIAAKTAESNARLQAIAAESAEKAREVAEATAQALVERFSPSKIDAADVNRAVAERLANRPGA